MSKLNKRNVDALQPRADGRDAFLWDHQLSGFGVRCRKSNRKQYVFKYRFGGRQRWVTIGRHGDPWTPALAREKAEALKLELAAGRDPAAAPEPDKRPESVAELCDRFMADYAAHEVRESTRYHYERMIRLHIKPELGAVEVPELDKPAVERLKHRLSDRPYEANRSVDLLSVILTKAAEWGSRPDGSNPVRWVKRYTEEPRERYLSEAEFARLGEALAEAERDGSVSPPAIGAIRLLMLTGARLGEVLNLRWDDIDWERGILQLPTSKTGKKTVQVNRPALELLEGTPRLEGNPFVFPGKRPGQPIINLQKPWRRVRERAGLDGVRIHDLRHSFAAQAAASGLSLPVIGKLLGHSQARITQRYAHVADPLLREANQRVGDRIAQHVQGGGRDG